MKRSRRERRAYNEGKSAGCLEGYLEGYLQGLHDGNPYITLMEAVSSIAQSVIESTKNDLELQKALKEAERARRGKNDR